MFYSTVLYLLKENATEMEITAESIIAGLVLLGAIIGVWTKVNQALKEMQIRVDLLEKMVEKQIAIDERIQQSLAELSISLAKMQEQIINKQDKS